MYTGKKFSSKSTAVNLLHIGMCPTPSNDDFLLIVCLTFYVRWTYGLTRTASLQSSECSNIFWNFITTVQKHTGCGQRTPPTDASQRTNYKLDTGTANSGSRR